MATMSEATVAGTRRTVPILSEDPTGAAEASQDNPATNQKISHSTLADQTTSKDKVLLTVCMETIETSETTPTQHSTAGNEGTPMPPSCENAESFVSSEQSRIVNTPLRRSTRLQQTEMEATHRVHDQNVVPAVTTGSRAKQNLKKPNQGTRTPSKYNYKLRKGLCGKPRAKKVSIEGQNQVPPVGHLPHDSNSIWYPMSPPTTVARETMKPKQSTRSVLVSNKTVGFDGLERQPEKNTEGAKEGDATEGSPSECGLKTPTRVTPDVCPNPSTQVKEITSLFSPLRRSSEAWKSPSVSPSLVKPKPTTGYGESAHGSEHSPFPATITTLATVQEISDQEMIDFLEDVLNSGGSGIPFSPIRPLAQIASESSFNEYDDVVGSSCFYSSFSNEDLSFFSDQ